MPLQMFDSVGFTPFLIVPSKNCPSFLEAPRSQSSVSFFPDRSGPVPHLFGSTFFPLTCHVFFLAPDSFPGTAWSAFVPPPESLGLACAFRRCARAAASLGCGTLCLST